MAPTTYYEDRDGNPAGPEYELVQDFARNRHIQVRFQVLESVEEIFEALGEGKGDLAAAGLTLTESRAEMFQVGPEYKRITEVCVCHKDSKVESPADLGGLRLTVVKGSSYEETLLRLKRDQPDLGWSSHDSSTEQLLKEIWDEKIDCTIADSNILEINQRYFPEIEQAFTLGEERSLVWYLPQGSPITHDELERWFVDLRQSGRFEEIENKYYGHIDEFDYYDTRVFLERIDDRLPPYEPLFRKAASESGFPWQLLAAVSYQESHWDPQAVSPTGVRGLFMLTQSTARSLGVTNRLDPQQSVFGGARYLRKMSERIPAFIENPDRLWMALAAYNVGFAHLQDARRLAIDLNRNPNKWHSLKEILPYLTQKKYFGRLRHGYARGYEPVLFVEHVRHYHDILSERLNDPKGSSASN
jgi:membrane-bound lytic murein transglycosylase F